MPDRRMLAKKQLQLAFFMVVAACTLVSGVAASEYCSTESDVLSALNSASEFIKWNRIDEAKQYVDKAIDVFESYPPTSVYDCCLGRIILNLDLFTGDEYDRRLDRVLRRSELVCKTDDCRLGRDRTIIDHLSNRFGGKDVLLRKLIFIREDLSPQTGASSASLFRELAWEYQNSVDGGNAVKAIKKAIARSEGSARSFNHAQLVYIYLNNKEMDLAKSEWRNVGKSENWMMSHTACRSLANLAKRFDDAGETQTCDEILAEVFLHSSQSVLDEFDDIIRQRIKEFLSSSDFASAEALIKMRINAANACGGDNDFVDWNMQLSELHLLTGRAPLSKHIYDEVRHKLIKNRVSTGSLDLRRAAALRQSGVESTDTGRGARVFRERKAIATFPCVLYAFSELSLSDNTMTGSGDSRLTGQPLPWTCRQDRGAGDVGSPGKIEISGNTVVFGSIFGKVVPDITPQISVWNRLGKTKIVRHVPKLPKTLFVDHSSARTQLGDFRGGDLAGGDYEATSISGGIGMGKNLTKPIRIFITDARTDQRYAVNLRDTGHNTESPQSLQIYYFGFRPIVLPHNSNVNAVIYAPYSSVTMGDNNCDFRGALIADRITTIGNVSATYDRALTGKEFIPGAPSVELDSGERDRSGKSESQDFVSGNDNRKPADWRTMLAKYPAIANLNLITGPIVYSEKPDTRSPMMSSGIEADGREIRVDGVSSDVTESYGDGTMRIMLDGLRLTDKALISFEEGDLERAERILVAALKADPDSETFGLLAECWYFQGKLTEALQACDLALEFDVSNGHAVAIRQLITKKLGRTSVLSEADNRALKSSIGANANVEKLTAALSYFVLKKHASAERLFNDILKKHPQSWRTFSWKQAAGR